jgi:hypothetical protein
LSIEYVIHISGVIIEDVLATVLCLGGSFDTKVNVGARG